MQAAPWTQPQRTALLGPPAHALVLATAPERAESVVSAQRLGSAFPWPKGPCSRCGTAVVLRRPAMSMGMMGILAEKDCLVGVMGMGSISGIPNTAREVWVLGMHGMDIPAAMSSRDHTLGDMMDLLDGTMGIMSILVGSMWGRYSMCNLLGAVSMSILVGCMWGEHSMCKLMGAGSMGILMCSMRTKYSMFNLMGAGSMCILVGSMRGKYNMCNFMGVGSMSLMSTFDRRAMSMGSVCTGTMGMGGMGIMVNNTDGKGSVGNFMGSGNMSLIVGMSMSVGMGGMMGLNDLRDIMGLCGMGLMVMGDGRDVTGMLSTAGTSNFAGPGCLGLLGMAGMDSMRILVGDMGDKYSMSNLVGLCGMCMWGQYSMSSSMGLCGMDTTDMQGMGMCGMGMWDQYSMSNSMDLMDMDLMGMDQIVPIPSRMC